MGIMVMSFSIGEKGFESIFRQIDSQSDNQAVVTTHQEDKYGHTPIGTSNFDIYDRQRCDSLDRHKPHIQDGRERTPEEPSLPPAC